MAFRACMQSFGLADRDMAGRIARLIRSAGLVGASRRRAGVTTTRRDRDVPPAPDLVEFLYLAVVLDAWSRKIVGWSVANHLRAELVMDALEMAIGQRRPGDVIRHSDQGSQSRPWRSVIAAARPECARP